MATHLVLDRSHHGPRLIGTFSDRGDAEALRGGLIHDNPTWEDRLTIVSDDDRDDSESWSVRVRPGGIDSLGA